MPSLINAGRKTPPAGQPKPQAPSTYPEDVLGSGAPYLGTAPMPPPTKQRAAKKFKMHAPGRKRN